MVHLSAHVQELEIEEPIAHLTKDEPERTSSVLLVEDQSIIALATTNRLTQDGYAVVVARSGEEAVTFVEEAHSSGQPFRLVLMDIDLGDGIDGVETSRRILERHELPIVFLTSHTEPEYVERVREVTRYGYVLKTSGDLILRMSMEMAIDLFEANQLTRAQEMELETIFDNAPLMMLVADSGGGVVKANRRAREADGRHMKPSFGSVVSCIRASADPAACGRHPACSDCQLRSLVADTLELGRERDEECIGIEVQTAAGPAFRPFVVSTSPFEKKGQRYVLVSILDLDRLAPISEDCSHGE